MPGIRIKHKTLHSGMYLVPLLHKPLYSKNPPKVGKDECPTCQVIHPVKTIHLHLEGDGSCIVSQGVLDALRTAGPEDRDGLKFSELEVDGEVKNPPPLQIGNGKVRAEVDQENRKITQFIPNHI